MRLLALLFLVGCSDDFGKDGNDPGGADSAGDTGDTGDTDDTQDTDDTDTQDTDDTQDTADTAGSDTGDSGADTDDTAPAPEEVDDDGDGYAEVDGDCDDATDATHPGANETPYDGLDNDCDAATPDDDVDGDGVGHAEDCDDDDATVSPDATEVSGNGADDDCDGTVDERFDVSTLDASCDCGHPSAIGVDSAGDVHVVYHDADAGTIRWMRGDDAGWDTAVEIVSDATSGEWLDAVVDDADQLQVAYTLSTGRATELDYVYMDAAGTWSSAYVVDDASVSGSTDVGYYVSIAVDGSNLPSLAYFDNDNGVPLLYDSTTIGVGVVGQIDYNYAGATGYWTSLAIDSADWDHVAYYDDGALAHEVQYALPLDGVFSETVDDAGTDVTLAIRSDDVACIAFRADADADLVYGCREGEVWSLETVDSTGSVGEYAQLAFDSADEPWIAYYDTTNGDLKVATRESGAWTTMTVDGTGDVGLSPSIAIDADDRVHVSYYDATTGALKYAVGE